MKYLLLLYSKTKQKEKRKNSNNAITVRKPARYFTKLLISRSLSGADRAVACGTKKKKKRYVIKTSDKEGKQTGWEGCYGSTN